MRSVFILLHIPVLISFSNWFSLVATTCVWLVGIFGYEINMNREQQTLKHVGLFCLVGIGLLGITLFTPDASQTHGTNFFTIARQTNWQHPLDWAAAWCSLKIILLSLGFFLIVDSLGTLLVKFKYRIIASLVFLLHLIPCLGVLAGGFYLLKSLL